MKKMTVSFLGFIVLFFTMVKINWMVGYQSIGIDSLEYFLVRGVDLFSTISSGVIIVVPYLVILVLNIIEGIYSKSKSKALRIINSTKTVLVVLYSLIIIFLSFYVNSTNAMLLGLGYFLSLFVMIFIVYTDDNFIRNFLKTTKRKVVLNVVVGLVVVSFVLFSIKTSKVESTLKSTLTVLEIYEETMLIDISGIELKTNYRESNGSPLEVGKRYHFEYHTVYYGFYVTTVYLEKEFLVLSEVDGA